MMTFFSRPAGMAAILCGLILGAAASPALAQKSGGSSAGGGGGGGGSKVTTTTVTVPLFGSYYGVGGSGSTVSTGSATLTYDATQTLRSMTLSVSNVHLLDGMIMHCVIRDNGLTAPTAYYPIYVPQLIANLPLSAGQATVSGSTLTLTGTGTVVVRAAQAGNSNFLAATTVDVERKIRRGEAERRGFWLLGVQRAHGIPGLGVGRRVAARGAAERRLIDQGHRFQRGNAVD